MKTHVMVLGLVLVLCGPSFASDYEYEVEGYADDGFVSGSIEANRGERDVDGYIHTEDDEEVYFEGEWTGKGEIEGYDENGNYYELEVTDRIDDE